MSYLALIIYSNVGLIVVSLGSTGGSGLVRYTAPRCRTKRLRTSGGAVRLVTSIEYRLSMSGNLFYFSLFIPHKHNSAPLILLVSRVTDIYYRETVLNGKRNNHVDVVPWLRRANAMSRTGLTPQCPPYFLC